MFLILGTGPLKHELQNLVHTLGLSHRVRFIGFVDYADIPRYFSISHAFIRASLSEGLGNSFLEAMYFGLPTIGTRAGGIRDFLFDGKTGFVCDPLDELSIVSAVNRALGKEDVRENAQKLVREQYDWDFISETFEKICAS